MGAQGLPTGLGADESTPETDGRHGSSPGPNAERSSSLNIPASLNRKRKASDMEETEDSHNATHFRSPIKQEPELPIDNSQAFKSSINPSRVPIKQESSADDILPERGSSLSNSRDDVFKPSSRLDKSVYMVKQEADSPDQDLRAIGDIEDEDRESSQDSSEPDIWDVSESEFDTSEEEGEDSSDGESAGSAFSLGKERDESGDPDKSPPGPDNHYSEESDEIVSRRRTVPNQSSNSRKQPSEMQANESNIMERGIASRGALPNHGDPASDSDKSSESPENRGNTGITVTGKPRQRAAAQDPMIAQNIPRSWKTAIPADRMLVKMKEKGCSWLEIRKVWQDLTGQWPAASTLPNRYKRVKDNLTRLRSGDGQRLLDAAADVEAQFQREKWRLIADAMERAGAAKYSNAFLQKKYDELSRNPSMFDTLVDDESSDASESNPPPSGVNVTRLQHPGANSTTATAPKRSKTSRGSSHPNLTLPGTAERDGSQIPGENEPRGSGRRHRGGPPEGPTGPTASFPRKQRKGMSEQRALAASARKKRTPRPYECKTCLGRYRKQSGLRGHWKRNPGCDPESRRRTAAKSVRKETAADCASGVSESEVIAGSSFHTPKMQMVFEISSTELTPEIGGQQH